MDFQCLQFNSPNVWGKQNKTGVKMDRKQNMRKNGLPMSSKINKTDAKMDRKQNKTEIRMDYQSSMHFHEGSKKCPL